MDTKTARATKAENYRKKAIEAEDLALKAKDLETKRVYLEVAHNWREIAARAERNGW